MRSTLIDAGPLIALFDRDDAFHDMVKSYLEDFHGRLVTTWPVITEASHLLSFSSLAQVGLMTWMKRSGVRIFPLGVEHLDRLIQLVKKYSDLPLDLADGSLVVAAEDTAATDILTIDSDYSVYRTASGRAIRNILRKQER